MSVGIPGSAVLADTQASAGNVVFQEGIANFSFSLYSTAIGQTGVNEFISPFSVSAALLLLSLGTGGTTKSQLLSTLFDNRQPSNVHSRYRNLQRVLASRMTKDITLSLANKLFVSQKYTILDSYTDFARKYYGSGVEKLNFANSEQSRTKINNWVASKTNDKIQDMILPGILNTNTLLVIANAIYFKGTWKTQFKPQNTKKRNFRVGVNDQRQVDMMFGTFPALSGQINELGCKVLQLPYSGDKLSMVFILPNVGNTLSQIEKWMSFSMLKIILSGLQKRITRIRIPKFRIESEYDLKPSLERLGITEIFYGRVSNFTNMVPRQIVGRVYVSDARHKAYFEVNENGSEAAAATTINLKIRTRAPKIFRFVAKRPFMFVIRDNISGTILFMGKYVAP